MIGCLRYSLWMGSNTLTEQLGVSGCFRCATAVPVPVKEAVT